MATCNAFFRPIFKIFLVPSNHDWHLISLFSHNSWWSLHEIFLPIISWNFASSTHRYMRYPAIVKQSMLWPHTSVLFRPFLIISNVFQPYLGSDIPVLCLSYFHNDWSLPEWFLPIISWNVSSDYLWMKHVEFKISNKHALLAICTQHHMHVLWHLILNIPSDCYDAYNRYIWSLKYFYSLKLNPWLTVTSRLYVYICISPMI